MLCYWKIIRNLSLWSGVLCFSAAFAAGPPEGFTGHRYIDAEGCVIEKRDGQWQPRILSGNVRDCGYPPTPFDLGAGAGIFGSVQAQLAAAEKRGDLLPLPPSVAEGPADGTKALSGQLAVVMRQKDSALGAGLPASRVNNRLCELIGQISDGQGDLGDDPSRGFCPGPSSGLRLAGPPVAVRQAVPREQARPDDKPLRKTAASRPVADKVVKGRSSVTATADGEALIPAGTSYLVVGVYSKLSADMSKIQAMGLPLAKASAAKVEDRLLVGPFASRQAIVRAYDRLRQAGYTQLEPL